MLPQFTRVTMARSLEGPWEVQTPTGPLDISGTQTEGLQEAINYAATNGLGLEVIVGTFAMGGQERTAITCKTTIDVPTIENAHWRFEGVILRFPGVAGDGVRFDSMLHCDLNLGSVIEYRGNGAAVHIHPRAPYDARGGLALFVDNRLWITRILVFTGDTPDGLKLSGPNIQRNRFEMLEIEGEVRSDNPLLGAMRYGIHLSQDTSGKISNWFTVQALLRPGLRGIRVGQSAGSGNRFSAHIEPYGATGNGIDTAGKFDRFEVDITNGQGPFSVGIELQAGADHNIFVVQHNEGRPPLDDSSGKTANRFL